MTGHATQGGPVTQAVTYSYDAENRWVGESVSVPGQPIEQIRFAYDGDQIVLEFEGTGTAPLTTANLSHRYLWQPGVVDQLMADERTGLDTGGNVVSQEVLWALTDQQGSVRDLAKVNATTGVTSVVDHVIYNSFGGVTSEGDPSQGSLVGYTGRPTDSLTGIEFHDERVKIAGSTDWMSVDPTGFTAGQTNTRDYCGNSPTNATDPSGLWTIGSEVAGVETSKPWHERLTLNAAIFAGYSLNTTAQITDSNLLNYTTYLQNCPFLEGLVTGSRAVDAPCGAANLAACFALVTDHPDYAAERYPVTFASHFGSEVYKHGMVPHPPAPPSAPPIGAATIRDQMVQWICDQYQKALDARTIKDTSPPPSPYYVSTLQLQYAPTEDSGEFLGEALHTLEDSYCPAHVWRGGASSHSANGPIYMFQDYDLQDHEKHEAGDDKGTSDYTNMCYYAAQAACTQLLKMFREGKTAGDVKAWLVGDPSKGITGPLTLAPGAVAGGTDPAYARTPDSTRWVPVPAAD
ncbi:MAG: RHS repeat-associated core domain-containing protein [Thermoguttaceae bacterium]